MFVASGGLFRPTSKRERSQRTVARNAKLQTRALREQNRLIEEQNQLFLDAETSAARQERPIPVVNSVSSEPKMSKLDKLAALGKLHSTGVLTDEEFALQKSALLESD